MLNLRDIDAQFPETHDGSVFSDLHKDVYGFRPRSITFESLADFDAEYERLVVRLGEQMDEEDIIQARNFTKFVARVEETMQIVQRIDRERAIKIIAEAEDEAENLAWYGYERLEYHFNLKYGSIKQWLATVDA
jgi:uncharacterized protein YabN with tetrapyrrole methylase and pyrophosphatase domain